MSVICRATTVNNSKNTFFAEILIESNGMRKSVSVNSSQDLKISVGDRISCLVGKVSFGVPTKPNVKLFSLSSQKINRSESIQQTDWFGKNEIIIEERMFDVMQILSN